MAKKFRKIGVLTSGGDAPGMNAVVRAVTRAALANGVEVMGICGGYSGLIKDEIVPLTSRGVSNVVNEGGTMLYSDRCLEFKTEEGMAKAIETCKKYEIDGIIACGGDGTFRGATDLSLRGIPTIGIPGTIDNDITSTDYTIGFDTAMNTVVEMVDRLRDTCESHARCNVIEVMGRNAGDIAIQTGIACGAVATVLREIPFDEDACMEKMKKLRAEGKRGFIVIVAEGVENFSEGLAKRIQEKTGIETKFARLAHVVRGGSPTLRDRFTAAEMAYSAVEHLLAGESDIVICESNNRIVAKNIKYTQMMDRMYKGTLKDGDLDGFTPEQIAEMKEACAEKKAYFERLYRIMDEISY